MPDLQLTLPPARTLLVAELSANHGGSLSKAIETVEAAATAGADAIKLQTYTPDTLTIDCESDAFRIKDGLWEGRSLYELYEEAHTPWEWHGDLKAAANRLNLPLFSTPFDATAVDFLETLGVPAYKIASFELGDLELIAKVAATGKPIIASTGMADLVTIDQAVRTIRRVWQGRDHGLALLRCVSAYPAAPRDMNLRTIPHLGQAFGVLPGLSDHTLGTAVAVTSIALGARVIEKHFILRRSDGGPDSAFSLEPDEFARLVEEVRVAEEALGEVRYGPSAGDVASRAFRRSLFVVEPVSAGEPFTRRNIRAIRPGQGMEPRHLPFILGRRAACDLERGTPLDQSVIEGWDTDTILGE
jgi:N-acetylneuraminate synthase